ncbi:MAG: hypothetical protein IKF80_09030 [Erysipelotrichaceae bacterium]|nr:hypothetical protein [Erysipelotrichaceae bacterium]
MAVRFLTRAREKELIGAIKEGVNIHIHAKDYLEDIMEDNKASIHVNVNDLYDHVSMGKFLQLDSSIFDYIEKSANLLSVAIPLRIIMHNVDKKEQENVKRLYKIHYQAEIQDILWDQRILYTKMIVMTLIGVAFILLYIFFALQKEDNLFLEILSIIGSFALSETVGSYLLERPRMKNDLLVRSQFLTAEIRFEE